ncbi:hypothetical protein [Providencia rettgeri]|uniref:hypothetical protein n=1 Tax=Providencia rettgeri TaxID=587 RepID=UPI0034E05A3D
MKRIKTKLLIVLLLALGVFAYHFYTTIGDSDVENMAKQLVEKKLERSGAITFSNVRIVLKNEYKEGSSFRVCGQYQLAQQSEMLPFVASVNVQEGKFSEHNQLIISETPELEISIDNLCTQKS